MTGKPRKCKTTDDQSPDFKPKAVAPDKALARLEDLCSRAEHSTGELREKLYRWRVPSADAEKIIEKLRKERYVDDRRFARSYVNDKIRFARWGRRKVQAGLMAKRVDNAIIREALDNIDIDEYTENLHHVLLLKVRSKPELLADYDGRTRLYRFALSRGYEPDLASRVLRSLVNDEIK